MKPIYFCLLILSSLSNSCVVQHDEKITEQDYINAWKQFYPSKALAQGMHDAVFDYEDRSKESIDQWMKLNEQMQRQLKAQADSIRDNKAINRRLLRVQIQNELYHWQEEAPHRSSASFYVNLIDRTFDQAFNADFLPPTDKAQVLCSRFQVVQNLCAAAMSQLEKAKKEDIDKSLEVLEKIKSFYQEKLRAVINEEGIPNSCYNLDDQIDQTLGHIEQLIDFFNDKLQTDETPSKTILGREVYARRLANYLDQPIFPEQLAELALQEIQDVRVLIGKVSGVYLKEAYPNRLVPESFEKVVRLAFDDMENDAPRDGADYLDFWKDLADAAMQFIEDNKIATLPEYQTLRIMPAPESAGPAARIGWVDSAPPFDPNPVTTLYLPNIPDTFPAEDRKDFWSSFNKPFNRMIVIHELFPGHYMQIKVSRETPHAVRLLFPYGPYFEGWASFTEEVLLDAGWEKERPLTYLAHLRKRLENANRAYTSVMVHCHGWNEEQVMKFSTETSLLAPQFAKSLWGRLLRSPMQMTSYFYGGMQFRKLLKSEKERQRDQFDLQLFMDTIMKTGPIPIEGFNNVFREIKPR